MAILEYRLQETKSGQVKIQKQLGGLLSENMELQAENEKLRKKKASLKDKQAEVEAEVQEKESIKDRKEKELTEVRERKRRHEAQMAKWGQWEGQGGKIRLEMDYARAVLCQFQQ